MNCGSGVHVEVNVTKIVKYVCLAGVIIVSVIFCEKGYKEYLTKNGKTN